MLNETQLRVLKAAVNRVIPADDYPCGWDAGVGDFFDLLFVREPRYLPVYQTGLAALDAEARAVSGAPFAELDADAQDSLLRRVEIGDVRASWPHKPDEFFSLLIEQSLEGFYADPGNGGNKNCISWEMVGFVVTA